MNVLSLFDGISCGRVALERAGVEVGTYYSSEIEKHPIAITQHNYPDTVQLGDVTQWREWGIDWSTIDLIQGGSPCQGFSQAGKQLNFDDPRSKLFFEFVDILNHVRKHNPDVKFLLENVRMKKEYSDIITEYMGVQPVMIDSALLSAQRRKRLYWTNICDIEQPDDQGILLQSILLDEDDVDEKYYMSENWLKWWDKNFQYQLQKQYSSLNADKAITMTARQYANWNGNFVFVLDKMLVKEGTKKGYTIIENGECVDLRFIRSKTRKGRRMKDKSNCLTVTTHDVCRFKDGRIRRLTPVECERLQTLPDNYTEAVADGKRYESIGNGWTVDVIAHIYQFIQ